VNKDRKVRSEPWAGSGFCQTFLDFFSKSVIVSMFMLPIGKSIEN
jgi:hypothetical protein